MNFKEKTKMYLKNTSKESSDSSENEMGKSLYSLIEMYHNGYISYEELFKRGSIVFNMFTGDSDKNLNNRVKEWLKDHNIKGK